jgi:hypothetical protein
MNKINDHRLSNLYFSKNIVSHSLKSPGKILFARKAKAPMDKCSSSQKIHNTSSNDHQTTAGVDSIKACHII